MEGKAFMKKPFSLIEGVVPTAIVLIMFHCFLGVGGVGADNRLGLLIWYNVLPKYK